MIGAPPQAAPTDWGASVGQLLAQSQARSMQLASTTAEDQLNRQFEAQKLQMAQQLQMQRFQGSPTSGTYARGNGSPLTQSLVAAKNLSRTTALSGVPLTSDQSSQLDLLEKDPNTPTATFEGLVNRIRANHDSAAKTDATQQASTAEIESKKHFVQQIAPSIKDDVLPEEGHGLWQMALDPKMSMNELRQQANEVVKNISTRKQVATQQTQKQQALQQATSAGAIHEDDVGTIQAAAADPKVTSQQLVSDIRASASKKSLEARQALNRQLRGINSQRAQTEKDATEIEQQNKGFINFDQDESQFKGAGNEQYIAALRQWKQKKTDADTLSQKAAALSNVGTGPGLATSSTQFVQTATNPATGHKIGQRPDGQWVDAQTGQPVDSDSGVKTETLSMQ